MPPKIQGCGNAALCGGIVVFFLTTVPQVCFFVAACETVVECAWSFELELELLVCLWRRFCRFCGCCCGGMFGVNGFEVLGYLLVCGLLCLCVLFVCAVAYVLNEGIYE